MKLEDCKVGTRVKTPGLPFLSLAPATGIVFKVFGGPRDWPIEVRLDSGLDAGFCVDFSPDELIPDHGLELAEMIEKSVPREYGPHHIVLTQTEGDEIVAKARELKKTAEGK